MMNASGQSEPTCRTCFDTTDKTFYSLTGKLVKDEERKTIAGFLWDIAKMDNKTAITKDLPQQICGNCLRKLKVSFSFVAQIQKVNKEMLKAVRKNKGFGYNLGIEDTDGSDNDSIDNEDNHENYDHENTMSAHEISDPIAVSRAKHTKQGKRGECVPECAKDSTLCGNGCHTEMKAMLHKLMSLQYQMNARMKFANSMPKEKPLTKKELQKMKQQECLDKNGKVVDMNSIKSWFPIKSVQQADEVERRIENGRTDEVVAFLERIFSFREATVDDVLRYIFEDDLADQFNLEGRSGKLSLISYNSILHCVRSIFPHLPTDVFLKMIRTYVLRCHNRNKQKKRNSLKRDLKAEQDDNGDEEAEEEEETENNIIDEANNESQPMFAEFMSEDSIMIENEIEYDTKSDAYSITNEEYLEEVVVDGTQPAPSNSNAGNMVSSNLEELPNIVIKQETIESKVKMADIASLFPLSSHDAVGEIEKNLKDPEFAAIVVDHIKAMKAHKGDMDKVLRCMFSDTLISDYNYDGRIGKRSLSGLNLVSMHLHNVYPEIRSHEFLTLIRKYVFMSHNRVKHNKYHARRFDVFSD